VATVSVTTAWVATTWVSSYSLERLSWVWGGLFRVAEHASVVRIIRFKPASGKRDELIALLQEGAEQIRQMDGCFGVQVCAVREAPDEVASISRWASQSALEAFIQASQTQRPALNALAAEAPVTEHLTPI
jgi:quinol monooxygenase YgiN